ncbi:MAG: hypothetical protein ACI4DY_04125 [Monoglobaceae bacterium]
MFKRIIAAMCTVSLLMMSMQLMVSAADTAETSISEKEKMLDALGIQIEEIVYRDNFVQALAGFFYDDPKSVSAADAAYQMGLIESGEKFVGKSGFTIDEALKYAVIVLGYKPVAEEMGGYNTIANQLRLADGIGATDTRISHDSAVRILYNMLDAKPMKRLLSSGGNEYAREDDATILELNRNIYKVSGIVTANEYTSLYDSKDRERQGYIRIDKDKYLLKDPSEKELIGRNVEAYVHKSKDNDDEIIYITENRGKDRVLELDAEDIESAAKDFSSIKYIDGNESRSVNLEPVLSVIYNGVSYADYTADDLKPTDGSLTLIDNDKNGRYDVVVVKAYQTIVVKSIDRDEKVLNNKYTFKGSTESIDLEDNDYMDYRIYNGKGEEVDFSYIEVNDILSVMQSKSGEVIPVSVYVSRATVGGTVETENGTEPELTIGGKLYKMSDSYLKFLDSEKKTTKVGDKCTFYLDYFGKIAYSISILDDSYCMFYKAANRDVWDYQIKFMDINGEWNVLPLANNVKIDDIKMSTEKAFSEIDGASPQVVKIHTNSKGEVDGIDFAEAVSTYDEDKFTKIGEISLYYRAQDDMRSFECKYYAESGAKLFVIPKDINDMEGYYVRNVSGFFTPDHRYPITIYDISKYNTSAVFSIKDGDWNAAALGDAASKRMIVTGVGQKWVDGEIRSFIEGGMGEYTCLSLLGEESDVFNGIQVGDIVALGLNLKNDVDRVSKIASAKAIPAKDMTNYYSEGTLSGTIVDYDPSRGIIIMDCGKKVYFYLKSTRLILKYSISNNKCDIVPASEITAGNKITFLNKYGTVNSAVYVTE